MTLPDDRSPLPSNNLKSPSTACPHRGTAFSKPASARRASELVATYGVNYFARTTFLQADAPAIGPPKNASAPSSHNIKLLTKTGRRGSKSILLQSTKSSTDVQVEILFEGMLKLDEKKASRTTLPIACLLQPYHTVGCNLSSPPASSASVKEGLYSR